MTCESQSQVLGGILKNDSSEAAVVMGTVLPKLEIRIQILKKCFGVSVRGRLGDSFGGRHWENWGNPGGPVNQKESTLDPWGSQGNLEGAVITDPIVHGLGEGRDLTCCHRG